MSNIILMLVIGFGIGLFCGVNIPESVSQPIKEWITNKK